LLPGGWGKKSARRDAQQQRQRERCCGSSVNSSPEAAALARVARLLALAKELRVATRSSAVITECDDVGVRPLSSAGQLPLCRS